MDSFFGLLIAIVGLMTVITLSVMELWVIPWPILLILLLLTLWISQRLIDRFNPAPVEGVSSVSPDPFTESSTVQEPDHLSDHLSDPIGLRYRGQLYEDHHPPHFPLPNSAGEGTPGDKLANQCYRGIPVESQAVQSKSTVGDPEHEYKPSPSPNPKSKPKLNLSYRGIKRS